MKIFLLSTAFFGFSWNTFSQTNPCNPDPKSPGYSSLPADTTITLEYGTKITFNRCEFFDLRDCIELKEIRTPEDLRASGLTTMDNHGNVLLSCGMVSLTLNPVECGKTCLDVPALISIPLRRSCVTSTAPAVLYTANTKGIWEASSRPSQIRKDKSGNEYLEFSMGCSGKDNCDRKMKTKKVKLKTKTFDRLILAEASMRCPLMYNPFAPKHRKKIIKIKLPCYNPDSIFIKVTAVDNNGDTKYIDKALSRYRTSFKKTKCPVTGPGIMRRVLGIFKFRQRNIYGKYFVE